MRPQSTVRSISQYPAGLLQVLCGVGQSVHGPFGVGPRHTLTWVASRVPTRTSTSIRGVG
ncbi:hypothetical protein [Micromonospora sp. NBRC 110038]|uniref:hypothetical protein n=1 Tax=Micromonospora sp. NBRC 110038 TaxID=1550034 RepID=UPI001E2D4562|nr:hypothetical protein [Micromonospora sp. NBRC 110038]